MPILCEVVTQERILFSDMVDMVVADGLQGRVGILPHHAPLLTTLKVGELILKKDGQELVFAIGGGVLDVQADKVTVLADSAEASNELDISRAEAARDRAASLLQAANRASYNPDEFAELTQALQRAHVRLKVVRRNSGNMNYN